MTDLQKMEHESQWTSLLKGQVALVTGASSGIGEATALALAAQGAAVAVAARRKDRLDELVEQIREGGGEAIAIEADVTDEEQAHAMVHKANAQWNHLDIIINNAGVMLLGPIDGANTEDWRRMININLLGLMYTTHAALPLLKTQNAGHFVNISSVAGRVARAGNGVYSATKWGVIAFSESLRQEVYKNRIRVTVIEPGAVDTELTEHITNPEAKKSTTEWISTFTPLESQDIAAAITYAVTQPWHVNVNEILIRPTGQDR